MSQSANAPFQEGDTVSYKYNGMQGQIVSVLAGGTLVASFPSQNRKGDNITVTLSASQVELIAGKRLLPA